MSNVIQILNLTKSYRVYRKPEGVLASLRGLFHREYEQVEAVCDIQLSIQRGEFVAFLGPNGAGKTTTLKLLSGIFTPTSGSATVLGYTPWERCNEYRRRFSLVMGQKNQLWWDLPATESFRLYQHLYRIESQKFERNRDQLAEMLDVQRLLERPVRELSLGERMKLELIAALLHDPEVLFLDEPTIGLDVVAQTTVQNFLRDYQAQRHTTILLTSHYMKDVKVLADRVVVICRGRIIYDGSLHGMIERFGDHKILSFCCVPVENEGTNHNLTNANRCTPNHISKISIPDDQMLRRLGFSLSVSPPRFQIRVPRDEVTQVLATLLDQYTLEDISVEDPPLESLLTDLFATQSGADPAMVTTEKR